MRPPRVTRPMLCTVADPQGPEQDRQAEGDAYLAGDAGLGHAHRLRGLDDGGIGRTQAADEAAQQGQGEIDGDTDQGRGRTDGADAEAAQATAALQRAPARIGIRRPNRARAGVTWVAPRTAFAAASTRGERKAAQPRGSGDGEGEGKGAERERDMLPEGGVTGPRPGRGIRRRGRDARRGRGSPPRRGRGRGPPRRPERASAGRRGHVRRRGCRAPTGRPRSRRRASRGRSAADRRGAVRRRVPEADSASRESGDEEEGGKRRQAAVPPTSPAKTSPTTTISRRPEGPVAPTPARRAGAGSGRR